MNVSVEKNCKDRETLSVLKKGFIATNNNITALEFHKKEHERHYKDLNFYDNFQDKILLFIEKWISHFGTDPLRPVFWFLLVNLLALFYYKGFGNIFQIDNIKENLNFLPDLMSPTKLLDLNSTDNMKLNGFEFFNFLRWIVNSFLLYEMIKSFRKFSKKF